jgi:type II secretory pathway pseudopilin PulG
MRHDAHLWIRPDAARWLPPGIDPAEVYPTLARKPDAAKAAAFEAEIAAGYRLLAVLREEVASLRAELKRRRLEEAKYSPTQPRVPAGNPRGGQWSNRNEGGSGFGSFGNAGGEASTEGTDGAEDTGSSGSSQDAATSEPGSSQRSEGDGTRGYDDRLAASDKPSPGRAAMLGIMARAAARVMEAYRSENGLFDLFGNRDGTVAYTTIDDKDIFGANSNSPTYTPTDRREAEQMRDTLLSKYPDVMNTTSIGKMPNDAVFHAESNVLLRAARENGGTLAGRSLDVFVDSKMCNNCEQVIPLVGLELGNPTITVVDTTKVSRTFRDGVRLK